MNIERFSGPGSTPSRRRFWDSIVELVASEEKRPGDNVVVTEHQGYGSLIDVIPQRAKNQSGRTGACCVDGVCSITTEADCPGNYLGDGTICEGVDCTQGGCCVDGVCSITTEAECTGHYLGDGSTCDAVDCTQGACCAIDGTCSVANSGDCAVSGGQYQGDGTTCGDVDCSKGACCVGGVCSQQTAESCSGLGGTFLAYGVPCVPNPCQECVCGGFLNPCDGLYYSTKTVTANGTYRVDGPPESDWDFTSEATYNCVDSVVVCSGSGEGSVHGGLEEVIHGTCGPIGDTNIWASLGGGIGYWVYDDSLNCSPCPKDSPDWTLTTDDCNHQQYTKTVSGQSGTVDAFIAYSNPCVLSGFSPPP